MSLVNQATTDNNKDDDDDNTHFMEQAQHLLCQESINGRHSVEAAEKEMMNIHHNSVRSHSKLPAKDFSLDTEEEMTGQKPELHWRKKKKEVNERFMVAVTQALNDVVTSHGEFFSDGHIAQLLALVLWNYANGVCQELLLNGVMSIQPHPSCNLQQHKMMIKVMMTVMMTVIMTSMMYTSKRLLLAHPMTTPACFRWPPQHEPVAKSCLHHWRGICILQLLAMQPNLCR